MRKKIYQNRNVINRYYRKFINLQNRVSLMMRSGEYFDLPHEIQHRLMRRLKLLFERLQRLIGKQKLHWAGAAMALILSASSIHAGYNDPSYLGGIKTDYWADPTFADVDVDGDKDIIIGGYNGSLIYAQNNNGDYSNYEVTNPFGSIVVLYGSSPAIADIDDDGDLDLVIGDFYGFVRYYENDGGTYTEMTGLDNPFDGISTGYQSNPALPDLDDDGDIDLVLGTYDGVIRYFENDGGLFSEVTGVDNPFDGIDVGDKSAPELMDYDNDGDLDLYIGEKYGSIAYYENIAGVYTVQTGADSPFDGVTVGYLSVPFIDDFDGDGDFDLAIGDEDNMALRYFENDNDLFTEKRGTINPLEGVQVGYNCAPWLADIDDDSDLDLVVGDGDGMVNYYENTGDSYEPRTSSSNPFNGIGLSPDAKPTMGDLDDDSDLDLVVGDYNGALSYFANDAGTYTELTGIDNPFDGINVGYYSSPTLVDFDIDGDLDLFVGEKYGSISYYENVSGTFTVQTGTDNPFDAVDIGYRPALTFIDFDEDGDQDVFIGEKYGSIAYFENDGGTLTQLTGADNPVEGVLVNGNAIPALIDADEDGDLDMYLGDVSGALYFSEFMPDGINVDIGSGLTTTEAGGTALFSVILESQPSDDVTIALSSSDESEGTVSPSNLIFTDANWNVAQLATITGSDDTQDDGDQTYSINFAVTSPDLDYEGMTVSPASVTNVDNDDPVALDDPRAEAIDIFSFEKTIVVDAGANVIKKVEILQMSGAFVTVQTVNATGKIELPVTELDAGIYIVRAYDATGSITTDKVIIR